MILLVAALILGPLTLGPPMLGPPIPGPPIRAVLADELAAAFPPGALAVARAPSGRALWESAPAQRAWSRLEAAGALAELEQGRAALRLASGTDPAEWLAFLFGGELQLAVYAEPAADEEAPPRRRLLFAARTPDAENCERVVQALLGVLGADGSREVKHLHHRGVDVARVGRDFAVAHEHEVFLLASTTDLLEAALDRRLDGAATELELPATDGLLSFRLQPELLQPRDARPVVKPARAALGKRIANPLGNLLFGGLLADEGPIHGALDAEADALELRLALPAVPADAPAAWFPPGEAAFAVPVSPQTVAVLALRRDVADWWRHRETLLPEDGQAELAKADQTLSLLFMGASPAEDIFAGLHPELALVVDRQLFADAPAPAVKLPAACLVARARDPATLGPALQVAFQSLVSFLNTERAESHRAPFLIDVVEEQGVSIRAARLLVPSRGQPDARAEPPGLEANASPAIALVDDWVLVGTSLEQVRRLVSALKSGALRTVGGGPFCAQVDVARGLQIARDDRDALVANSVVEDGLDVDEAGRRLDQLLGALDELRVIELQALPAADRLEVVLRVQLGPGAP